jgi:hypothetical protein
MMTGPSQRKRGRPPKTISFHDGTEMTLCELGISRKRVSDWIAIASLPKDVFEKRLADAAAAPMGAFRRMTSTQAKAPMRDPSALDVARKAVARLSRTERITLARELVGELTREGRAGGRHP